MGNLKWDPSQLDRCDGTFSGDPNELDRIEQMSVQRAIQLSLEDAQKTNKTKPTDLPKRKFKVEEIEEDEKKREIELYGPPTPPRRPRQVGAMKSSGPLSANKISIASGPKGTHASGKVVANQEAGTANDSKVNESGIFVPKGVIDKLPADVWSAVADAVAYHKQFVAEEPVRDIVDVMMGYNGKVGKGALPAWPRSSANNFPVSRGSRFAKKKAALLDHFRHGLDGAAAAAAPRPPNHAERMTVIRAALEDPDSTLSVAVREESQFVLGESSQRARGESSGGSQPGSKRA